MASQFNGITDEAHESGSSIGKVLIKPLTCCFGFGFVFILLLGGSIFKLAIFIGSLFVFSKLAAILNHFMGINPKTSRKTRRKRK